jgi:hypothetical protein
MNSTGEIGLKITAAQREYYRYTSASAELERRGAGLSRAALAWARRARLQSEGDRPVFQVSNLSEKGNRPEKKA